MHVPLRWFSKQKLGQQTDFHHPSYWLAVTNEEEIAGADSIAKKHGKVVRNDENQIEPH